jgi:MFS family permease
MSPERQQRLRPADFAGGVWHGALLTAGLALADPVALIPVLVDRLTGSPIWVGALASLMVAATAAPQLLVARYVEPLGRKRPVLLAAVYVRAASLAALGGLLWWGAGRPVLQLSGLVALLTVFSLAGAVGGVPYVDLIGKVIPRARRGLFFASKQAAGSLLALGASVLAGVLLALAWPENYAALFVVAGGLVALASLGVWMIREPAAQRTRRPPWRTWIADLRGPGRALLPLAGATWATGASLLAVPIYVVVAVALGAPDRAMAWFIGATVVGGLVSNLLWARLVDRWGAPRMIQVCVSLAVLAPLLGLASLQLGWPLLVVVMFLVGATQTGRKVGFSAALLEVAPAERRATWGATYALLGLPVAAMPLLGGLLAAWTSYEVLFALTAVLLTAALVVVSRWVRVECPPVPGAGDEACGGDRGHGSEIGATTRSKRVRWKSGP